MSAGRNMVMEPAKSWREVAPAHRREILKRLASLGDGYHFAGLLGMEAYVKLAIKELKRAAAEPLCDCNAAPDVHDGLCSAGKGPR